MSYLMSAVILVFFFILFIPWLALVSSPLAIAATAALTGAGGIRQWLLGFRQEEAIEGAIEDGLLCLHGLESEPASDGPLRQSIGRALEFAPESTHARACACVKKSGADHVGVLRLWNSRGHSLLRVVDKTARGTAQKLREELMKFDDASLFMGASRIRIPECDPASCPLRLLRRMRHSAAAA